MEHTWNAMLSMMKQAPKDKSSLENTSRHFDMFALHSCKAVIRTPLEAITATNEIQSEGSFPCEHKTSGRLGAYSMKGIIMQRYAISSMATKKSGFVLRTESIIEHDKLCENSASAC
jgi:hypothetical protein